MTEQELPTRTSQHAIRRLTVQTLYQQDMLRQSEWQQQVDDSAAESNESTEVQEQALSKERAVWALRSAADMMTSDLAAGWPSERQPAMDRAILRTAYYELKATDIPTAVIINEAIELAKTFSTERSGAFVNALTQAMAHRIRGSGHGSPLTSEQTITNLLPEGSFSSGAQSLATPLNNDAESSTEHDTLTTTNS